MRKFYYTNCTEYEAGQGQRPDDIVIAEDKEQLQLHINEMRKQRSYGCFTEYSEIHDVFVENENDANWLSNQVKETWDCKSNFNIHWFSDLDNIVPASSDVPIIFYKKINLWQRKNKKLIIKQLMLL